MSRRNSTETCPICGAPAAVGTRPFCGPGCKDRDLLQWLGEGYRIAGPAAGAEDAAKAQSGLDSDAEPD